LLICHCTLHPKLICSCDLKCDSTNLKCPGKPYSSKFSISCEFHAKLFELECLRRAGAAELSLDDINFLEAPFQLKSISHLKNRHWISILKVEDHWFKVDGRSNVIACSENGVENLIHHQDDIVLFYVKKQH